MQERGHIFHSLLLYKTLNISKGDEVIVQSFICNVAIDAILSHGAKPVLVDSSLKDFNISPSEIRKKITSKTKAIIIAHLYGIPCDIDEILSIAEENNCFLIEDCAHCINSKYKEKKVGTFGDISFFSFNFDKPLSTGNGGMLVVNNKKLVDKAKEILDKLKRIDAQEDKKIVYGLFIQHILTNREMYKDSLSIDFGKKLIEKNHNLFVNFDKLIYENSEENIIEKHLLNFLNEKNVYKNNIIQIRRDNNFFRKLKFAKNKIKPSLNLKKYQDIKLMNSARALVGNIELDFIDRVNEIRCKNSQFYEKFLKDMESYKLPVIDKKKGPVYLRYTVLNKTNHDIKYIGDVAKSKGLEIGNFNWPKPIHLKHPYNKILKFKRADLKNSEVLASNIINLPVHYYVKNQDIVDITYLLDSFK
jgi:dTDP-4-amino-4,6-dideoxygalactose transaminase